MKRDMEYRPAATCPNCGTAWGRRTHGDECPDCGTHFKAEDGVSP